MNDYPKLFLCKGCKLYRPIEELIEVQIVDLIFPANFCKKCMDEINKKSPEIEIEKGGDKDVPKTAKSCKSCSSG